MTIAVPTRVLGAIAWFPVVGTAIAFDSLIDFPLTLAGGVVAIAVFALALRVSGCLRGWSAAGPGLASAAVISVSATIWYSALDGQDPALIVPCFSVAIAGGIAISAWLAINARRARSATSQPLRADPPAS